MGDILGPLPKHLGMPPGPLDPPSFGVPHPPGCPPIADPSPNSHIPPPIPGLQVGVEAAEGEDPQKRAPPLPQAGPQLLPGGQQVLPVRGAGQRQRGPQKQHPPVWGTPEPPRAPQNPGGHPKTPGIGMGGGYGDTPQHWGLVWGHTGTFGEHGGDPKTLGGAQVTLALFWVRFRGFKASSRGVSCPQTVS